MEATRTTTASFPTRKYLLDPYFPRSRERQIASSRLARLDLRHPLVPATAAGSSVLSSKEMDLHEDRIVPCRYVSKKNRGLRSLPVTSPQKKVPYRSVSPLPQPPVVQGKIDIHAPGVRCSRTRQEKFRHPSAHDDEIVAVLAEQVDQLDQYPPGRRHRLGRIVPPRHHCGRITSSNSFSAASSPRPRNPFRSR